MYFSLTTLSSVGFGDFHPKSDDERLICIVGLVIGVCIFGILMGNFLEIIEKLNKMDADPGSGDELG